MNNEVKETKPAPPEVKPAAPKKSTLREYFESLVVTFVMAIFGMTFILQAVTVPTGSMQNTILVGDYLLVNKFIFTPGGRDLPFLPQREIERGDIIVFKYPGNNLCQDNDKKHGSSAIRYQVNYVKRVIGLPGETVEFKNNQVFINGQLLPEHRIIGDANNDISALKTTEFEQRREGENYNVYYSSASMNTLNSGMEQYRTWKDPCRGFQFGVEGKPSVVPENHFFVLGDSRNQSEDSRYWGFVPRDLIVGRAMFVYWSCDRGASNGSFFGCVTHPRLDRIFKFVK
jgi:signal peptidase I